MKKSRLVTFKSTVQLASSALLVLVSVQSISLAQCSSGCRARNGGYEPSLGQVYRSGYDANVQWPKIYIPPARRSVHAAYDAMINNGWRRQNLVGNYHFNAQTNELTDAGKLKVNWILTQAPVQRRNVFVQRGNTELQTTARLATVQGYAGDMSPATENVSVNDTHIVAEGHRASSVDRVFVGYEASRLPPVLPASTGGGSGE